MLATLTSEVSHNFSHTHPGWFWKRRYGEGNAKEEGWLRGRGLHCHGDYKYREVGKGRGGKWVKVREV